MDIHNYLKRTDRRCRYPDRIRYVENTKGDYVAMLSERFVFTDADGLVVRGACETHIPADDGVVLQFFLN
jgi:hypothetical protein